MNATGDRQVVRRERFRVSVVDEVWGIVKRRREYRRWESTRNPRSTHEVTMVW